MYKTGIFFWKIKSVVYTVYLWEDEIMPKMIKYTILFREDEIMR